MSILNHQRGEPAASNFFWSHVVRSRSFQAASRRLAVFQAYFDESDSDGGALVLGGLISSAERWADFSKDWENMLHHGTLAKNNEYHFKMNEMATSEERMERVSWFFRVAEKHSICFVSCTIFQGDLDRAWRRIYVPSININGADLRNKWLVSFRFLLDAVYLNRHRVGLLNVKPIELIFDERSEKVRIFPNWDAYLSGLSPEARNFYGSTPRFEDDQRFLPLQAADLWAWWVRSIKEGNQNWPKYMDSRTWIDVELDENGLFALLVDSIRGASFSERTYILDLATGLPVLNVPLGFSVSKRRSDEIA